MTYAALRKFLASSAALAGMAGMAFAVHAQTANSVVIWPIDPVIESKERAAPLWLENPGNRPLFLQVRVFAWNQDGGENHFADQTEVTGTPPVIRIEPGQRQMVRLTHLITATAGKEHAYRIIIDEIPQSASLQPDAEQPDKAGAAIQFRMRYSLPLYVYGEGLGSKERQTNPTIQPRLEWRVTPSGKGAVLEIRNTGAIHGKLTNVTVQHVDGTVLKLDMVTGHILAGATMRWELEKALPTGATIEADINGAKASPLPYWRPN